MSTVSEKLLQVAQNNPKVYHAGQLNIVKNAECLKEFKSDTSLLLDNVSPVKHDMGVKVHGKNLLPLADSGIYYKGSIKGGAPFIYNSSFGISDFNDIDISSYRGVYAVIKLIEGETYTLTINNLVNNCATQQIRLAVGFRSSEDTIFGTSETDITAVSPNYNPSSWTFTVPSGYPYCLVGFYNYPTVSGDTVSFNAMQLELGSTATDYEPYNDDIQNVYSKNLFDVDRITTVGNLTNNGDGTLTIAENSLYQTTSVTLGTVCPKLKIGDIIVFSFNTQGNKHFIYLQKSKRTFVLNTKYTITQDDLDSTMTIYGYGTDESNYGNPCIISNIQIEYGSTATEYEKYHEPYPLVISQYGKNLFDKDMVFITDNKVNNVNYQFTYFIQLQPNNSYYCKVFNPIDDSDTTYGTTLLSSLPNVNSDINSSIMISGNSSNNIWKRGNLLTTDSNGRLYIGNTHSISNLQYISQNCKIQIELGSTATDYEPYKSKIDYTPTSDGIINNVESIYPATTLLTNDPNNRVYIDCNYYKDIDKTFNELTTSVALSGGDT